MYVFQIPDPTNVMKMAFWFCALSQKEAKKKAFSLLYRYLGFIQFGCNMENETKSDNNSNWALNNVKFPVTILN